MQSALAVGKPGNGTDAPTAVVTDSQQLLMRAMAAARERAAICHQVVALITNRSDALIIAAGITQDLAFSRYAESDPPRLHRLLDASRAIIAAGYARPGDTGVLEARQ